MKHAFVELAATLSVTAGALALTCETGFAQSAKTAPASNNWAPAKTPWGDPDLQGTWTSDDCIGTPMQRPANLGEKLYLTEEDLAKRQDQLAKQREKQRGS